MVLVVDGNGGEQGNTAHYPDGEIQYTRHRVLQWTWLDPRVWCLLRGDESGVESNSGYGGACALCFRSDDYEVACEKFGLNSVQCSLFLSSTYRRGAVS